MALSNYSELKLKIIEQSHRDDIDLQVDDFILLAETEIRANPDEPLNIRENELLATGATVVDSDVVALPARYQRSRSLRITLGDSDKRIAYKTPATMSRFSGSGTPSFYTIVGDNIKFDINADAVYTVTFEYEADLDPLNDSNPTNNILTRYPNIYLYGALKQLFAWANDEDQVIKYNNLFLTAIISANQAEAIGRFGDTPERAVRWAP
jgi:hypothetical protein